MAHDLVTSADIPVEGEKLELLAKRAQELMVVKRAEALETASVNEIWRERKEGEAKSKGKKGEHKLRINTMTWSGGGLCSEQ